VQQEQLVHRVSKAEQEHKALQDIKEQQEQQVHRVFKEIQELKV
jgi:hypothetical protein